MNIIDSLFLEDLCKSRQCRDGLHYGSGRPLLNFLAMISVSMVTVATSLIGFFGSRVVIFKKQSFLGTELKSHFPMAFTEAPF